MCDHSTNMVGDLSTQKLGTLEPGQTMEDLASLSVVNLSSLTLSPLVQEVLSKGLTFCPTPIEPEMVDMVDGLDRLVRTMRHRAFFKKRVEQLEVLARKTRLVSQRGIYLIPHLLRYP